MSEWPIVELGDLAEFINGGAWSESAYSENGVPVVRVTNIRGDHIDLSDCKFLPFDLLQTYRKHLLKAGDLIIATVGSHPTQPNSVVGRPAIVSRNISGCLLNQNAVLLRKKSDHVDQRWLGYLGKSSAFREYIVECARGSANQVRMSIALLKKMPVALPPIDTQCRVASILGGYDDLIKVNRRRVEVLEEMARGLFEEWFVRFRFPGHESVPIVDTPGGPLPQGWSWGCFGDLVREIRDTVLPEAVEPGTPYVGLEHLARRSTTLADRGDADSVASLKARFQRGDILFGKIRPYFHKVAWAPFAGICSTDAIVWRPLPSCSAQALALASSDAFVAHSVQTSNGTKMPRANTSVLAAYRCALADSEISSLFERLVGSTVEQAACLQAANERLAASRDLLLPRLISGQLSVETAVRELELAA